MNIEQLGLQLGIAGLVLLIGYKLAVLLIRNWREAEKERTQVLADNFGGMTESMQRSAESLGRIEGGINALVDQRRATPAHGLRVVRSPTNGNPDKEK